MSNEIEVSNTALVVIFIGAIVGIILSIVLYKRKTLNERFIEKCCKDGCTARAEVVRKRTFYGDAGYHPANKDSKFFLTWEYTVNGKTYRKTTFEQATGNWGRHDYYRTIYYSKNNPRKARFAKSKSPVFGCLTGIIFLIVVILIPVKLFP